MQDKKYLDSDDDNDINELLEEEDKEDDNIIDQINEASEDENNLDEKKKQGGFLDNFDDDDDIPYEAYETKNISNLEVRKKPDGKGTSDVLPSIQKEEKKNTTPPMYITIKSLSQTKGETRYENSLFYFRVGMEKQSSNPAKTMMYLCYDFDNTSFYLIVDRKELTNGRFFKDTLEALTNTYALINKFIAIVPKGLDSKAFVRVRYVPDQSRKTLVKISVDAFISMTRIFNRDKFQQVNFTPSEKHDASITTLRSFDDVYTSSILNDEHEKSNKQQHRGSIVLQVLQSYEGERDKVIENGKASKSTESYYLMDISGCIGRFTFVHVNSTHLSFKKNSILYFRDIPLELRNSHYVPQIIGNEERIFDITGQEWAIFPNKAESKHRRNLLYPPLYEKMSLWKILSSNVLPRNVELQFPAKVLFVNQFEKANLYAYNEDSQMYNIKVDIKVESGDTPRFVDFWGREYDAEKVSISGELIVGLEDQNIPKNEKNLKVNTKNWRFWDINSYLCKDYKRVNLTSTNAEAFDSWIGHEVIVNAIILQSYQIWKKSETTESYMDILTKKLSEYVFRSSLTGKIFNFNIYVRSNKDEGFFYISKISL